MSTRPLQGTYSHDYQIRSPTLKLNDEPFVFGSMSYSSIQTPSNPTVPVGILKPSKRRSSTISLSSLLPRRKSLQTTALTTRRQSLWMNIARTGPALNEVQPAPLETENNNLMRKKILRLLLVFSYLLSISLFAIALATFYGFFWSGYKTTTSSPSPTIFFLSNSTLVSL